MAPEGEEEAGEESEDEVSEEEDDVLSSCIPDEDSCGAANIVDMDGALDDICDIDVENDAVVKPLHADTASVCSGGGNGANSAADSRGDIDGGC